jgi:hypothetical protein
MPDNQEAEDISRQLRLSRTDVRPTGGPRPGGLRLAAQSAARAAANPSVATEPVEELANPAATQGTAQATTQAAAAQGRAPAAESDNEVPGIVLLIGLYEFARAVTLAVLYGVMLSDPHTHMFSEGFWTGFYVLSNGALSVTPLLPVTILYAFAVGVCLWMRANWGRRVLIATSCWAVLRLARFLLFYGAVVANATDAEVASISYVRDAAVMLAAVNIIIGLYMAFGPGVAEAFGPQKQRVRTRG